MWISNSQEAGVFLVMANADPAAGYRDPNPDPNPNPHPHPLPNSNPDPDPSPNPDPDPNPNPNPNQAGYRGITCFVVPAGARGLSVGRREDKLGIRASSTCSVRLDGVRVPAEYVLGEVGEGYKYAINILNEGRIGIGALQPTPQPLTYMPMP